MTNPATLAARSLLQGLVEIGVRDIVLCPGSRSAPLAFAALALEQDDRVRLHIRHDERVGAFTALGAAKIESVQGKPRPAVVITTSGTAVANLHPAFLEAHHTQVPLIALTADRPHELRGVGANQTTQQVGIFGGAARWAVDIPVRDTIGDGVAHATYFRNLAARAGAAALGRGGEAGPVHLNLALRDPLISPAEIAAVPEWDTAMRGPGMAGLTRVEIGGHTESSFLEVPADSAIVVIAGDSAGDRARETAEAGGWPLFAEPSSGARSGANAIGPYRLMLGANALATEIERVIVFGHPTLSRPIQALLARPDIEVLVVHSGPNWPDPPRRASAVTADIRVSGEPQEAWLRSWQEAGARAAEAVIRTIGTELNGPVVAQTVVESTKAGQILWFGSSNPVRDADLAQPWRPQNAPLVAAHRGLAGIDGTISATTGAALASGLPARAFVGDLTLIHDLGALLIGPLERVPHLQIIVFDDDGGGIFETLEQGADAYRPAFERLFGTPHGQDLAAMLRGLDIPTTRVRDIAELRETLAAPIPAGISAIIIRGTRVDRRELNAQIASEVGRAL